MPNPELPILVVDDARFSGAIISRTLKSAGYQDVRTATSASQALTLLEDRPTNILIADWLMPEIDGLQLAAQVRQLDEASNHSTYIILLTAKEGETALIKAFDEGVDDFINKSTMTHQLLPRVYAADRISSFQNRLLQENLLLVESNQRLRKYSLVDPLTGLGNSRYTLERLDATLKHARSRGGVVGLMLVQLENYHGLEQAFGKTALRQAVLGLSRRLRQLMRPLDVVSRISSQEFVIITLQEDIVQANSGTYRRIYEALNVKAIKTAEGFISTKAAIQMVIADESTGFPRPDQMLSRAKESINQARDTGRIMVARWQTSDSVTEQP